MGNELESNTTFVVYPNRGASFSEVEADTSTTIMKNAVDGEFDMSQETRASILIIASALMVLFLGF